MESYILLFSDIFSQNKFFEIHLSYCCFDSLLLFYCAVVFHCSNKPQNIKLYAYTIHRYMNQCVNQ